MCPKDHVHGDWASNIAVQLAKKAGTKPCDPAEPLATAPAGVNGIIRVEVAGSGFINITPSSVSTTAMVNTVLATGTVTDADKHLSKVSEYDRSDHLGGQTLGLELASANPTGPIHIGGAHWTAVGDAMTRVFGTNGTKVVREYYFNDHDEQTSRFAKSLVATQVEVSSLGEAGCQIETPRGGYKSVYINGIATHVQAEAGFDGVNLTTLAH